MTETCVDDDDCCEGKSSCAKIGLLGSKKCCMPLDEFCNSNGQCCGDTICNTITQKCNRRLVLITDDPTKEPTKIPTYDPTSLRNIQNL